MPPTRRSRPSQPIRKVRAALASGLGLAARSLATRTETRTVEQRLADLPTAGLPVSAPVEIHWNQHLIPFIDARSDDDLAFALGYVEGHLRLAQIGVMRRIATGRLAESFGPIAAEIDAGLRVLGFGRAAKATVAALPRPTRRWVERFVAGLNHYQAQLQHLPRDCEVLGLGREPFSAEDVIAIGRLAGNDINWLAWFRLLRWRDRPEWPRIWRQAVRYGGNSRASFTVGETLEEEALDAILEGVSRAGSNSVVVAGERTASGAALIASDPHVGIFLPSLWMIVGLRSPGYHAVGLTIPGVPFIALGRNRWIAWGGTNMRAASSDLVDIEGLPEEELTAEEERIAVRWGAERRLTVRRSPYGTVISDAPMFPRAGGRRVALRWMGHRVTDEISAMLGVARAGSFEEFRAAMTTFGVSGQNFLYADRDGHIGQVMAVHLPARGPEAPADPVLSPEQSVGWDLPVTGAELPFAYDPPDGFLASANNQPAASPHLVGYFFAANDRIRRLASLLGARSDWTAEALASVQRDVVRPSALALRDVLVAAKAGIADAAAVRLLERLECWDGAYAPERAEPLALEVMAHELATAFDGELGPLRASEAVLEIIADRLAALDPAEAAGLVGRAAAAAGSAVARYGSWGAFHRLEVAHVLANLPVIGRRYPRHSSPVGGSTTTVHKTAHELGDRPHRVRFGANARHVSDLADLDANWFVLLGGQDGDLGSPALADQIPLWRQGRAIRVPLRLETVRAEFPHLTVLQPAD